MIYLRILMLGVLISAITGDTRLLENFERKLNSINDKISQRKSASPVRGKVKRYRCIEEYVSVDEEGNVIEDESTTSHGYYTTTSPPDNMVITTRLPSTKKRAKAHGVKTLKEKEYAIPSARPILRVKKINKKKTEKTPLPTKEVITRTLLPIISHTPVSVVSPSSTKSSPKQSTNGVNNINTVSNKSVENSDEIDDETADRLIEEMFLSKESPPYTTTKPTRDPPIVVPPTRERNPVRPQLRRQSTTPLSDTASYSEDSRLPTSTRNLMEDRFEEATVSLEDSRDGYSETFRKPRVGGRYRSRGRYDEDSYDDYEYYDDDRMYYRRGYRRGYAGRPMRPMYARSSLRRAPVYMDNRVPLMVVPEQVFPTTIISPQRQLLNPLTVAQGVISRSPVPPRPLRPISVQPSRRSSLPIPLSSTMTANSRNLNTVIASSTPVVNERLQLASNNNMNEQATPENCAKISRMAAQFSITDVSTWARSNCAFLKMYAPEATCEQIWHFIDSCRNKFFFKS